MSIPNRQDNPFNKPNIIFKNKTPQTDNEESIMESILNDKDDEEVKRVNQLGSAHMAPLKTTLENNPWLTELKHSYNKVNKKYQGVKGSRFITSDFLLRAPEDFFEPYKESVKDGTIYVRNKLVDNDLFESIDKAQKNPTDDAYQDDAYYNTFGLASDYVNKQTIWRDIEKNIVVKLICDEIIGMSVLEPLWRDRRIDEIMCNGPFDVQVEIKGEISKVLSCKFRDYDHIYSLISRLFAAINKTLAPTSSLLKGRLHDKSRIFATDRSIAPDGPNFQIRRHPEGFWTPVDFVERKSASKELMAYIGNIIYKGGSFLVSGGTHSGKMLTHDTIIQTPDGVTTMGKIQPGDRVFDHHGNVGNVVEKFLNPPKQVYRVKFSTGNEILAGAEHNWLVSTHSSRKSHYYRVDSKKRQGWERKTIFTDKEIASLRSIRQGLEYPINVSKKQLENLIGRDIVSTRLVQSLNSVAVNAEDRGHNKPLLYNTTGALEIILKYGSEFLSDQRMKRAPLWSVKTTQEMIDEGLTIFNNSGHKRYRFHVPSLERPVVYENGTRMDELPIHPYLLGLWLGDGTAEGNGFTGTPEDVTFYNTVLPEAFKRIGKTSENAHSITVKDFRKTLKNLNLINNKHIPDKYLFSEEDARRELLAGLLDSDGCVNGNAPGWIFTNTNERLIEGFIQVSSSLGYLAQRSKEKNKSYTYLGERKNGRTSWDVNILTHDVLAHLPRKIARFNEVLRRFPKAHSKHRDVAVVSIEKIDGRIEAMSCITVDTPDRTYLVGHNFTTTHNTSMLNALTGFYKPRVRIITMEDNIEMKPNPKKYLSAALECREPQPDRPKDNGVTMRDLVKGSLQMRPDVLIVGEVTDSAAFDLTQALNTGHAGSSTLHANDAYWTITRTAALIAQGGLVSREGALEQIASAFDIIISLKHFPLDGSRRIVSVDEVGMRPTVVDGILTLQTKPLWTFVEDGLDENRRIFGHWEQVGELSNERRIMKSLNIEEDLTWEQLLELSSIPEKYLPKKHEEDE